MRSSYLGVNEKLEYTHVCVTNSHLLSSYLDRLLNEHAWQPSGDFIVLTTPTRL